MVDEAVSAIRGRRDAELAASLLIWAGAAIAAGSEEVKRSDRVAAAGRHVRAGPPRANPRILSKSREHPPGVPRLLGCKTTGEP